MAGGQHEIQGCKGFKRTSQDGKIQSTKPNKGKRFFPKLKCKAQRARVNIGLAFERWRALKAAQGLKTDAEVAHCLLDVMKRFPTASISSEASDKKIKISQSEVQTLIKQEVCSAVRKNETRLQDLIETIQKLDHGVDYERSIQKLEARVNSLSKKAEVAFAYMTKTQTKSPHTSPTDMNINRAEPECETMENTSQTDRKNMDWMDKDRELFQMMETTKMSLKKMRADNDNLTAAIADLKEKPSPLIPSPFGSPKCKEYGSAMKKEPEEEQCKEDDKKLKAERVKVEHLPSSNSNTPNPTEPEKDKLSYPPLPFTIFPSILSMEAASYNIPQKPEVHLALIREPAGLSVLWKVDKEDPSAPPMDSYSIYMTTEKVKGSGTFPKWNMLGEVRAIKLPMCVMITKYKPGRKVCVAVVGKDIFGRYGPYSKVVAANIPD
ncbi:activating transcription factor 7-interacting protein 2 isoform X2 [Echeneis naucrates]|uniref:Activating transcription factor 7-interacting protein Fn3 domain-containing protein n=1 Tax=Echeneis naucrates TaxID=173247 RepID=A0A665W3K5_ECHNA|nr:activating transcription factor 7-interacting protein 2 isoform X2 [Echeneis naucrates]